VVYLSSPFGGGGAPWRVIEWYQFNAIYSGSRLPAAWPSSADSLGGSARFYVHK
jgi:hypothetical protein